MAEKMNYPDSDESTRHNHPAQDDEMDSTAVEAIDGLQTSGKAGKHSTAVKLAASRPDFGTGRRAEHVDGAFGKDDATVVEESDMGKTDEHRSVNQHKKAHSGA
jgi:hypothetical protein